MEKLPRSPSAPAIGGVGSQSQLLLVACLTSLTRVTSTLGADWKGGGEGLCLIGGGRGSERSSEFRGKLNIHWLGPSF